MANSELDGKKVELNRTIYRVDGRGLIPRQSTGTVESALLNLGKQAVWVKFDDESFPVQLCYLHEVTVLN